MQLTFTCKCGLVRGTIHEAETLYGQHFICMCDDCQAYAHYLGQANEVLDENGGTDVLPVPPAHFKITSGAENLKCVRLSEKGIYRWYAGCCHSPIANTLSPKLPYIGLIVRTVNASDRDRVLGPVAARMMAKYGIPPIPKDAHQGTPVSFMIHTLKSIVRLFIKRLGKPSPFFDSATGEPVVKPYVLTPAERERLESVDGH